MASKSSSTSRHQQGSLSQEQVRHQPMGMDTSREASSYGVICIRAWQHFCQLANSEVDYWCYHDYGFDDGMKYLHAFASLINDHTS
jgi:hypothetical protein